MTAIRDEWGREYPVPGPFRSFDHIRREHRQRGGHYFDADTGRFFRARYTDDVIAGAMFIDSVRGPGMPREYRLKVLGQGASVATVVDPATGNPAEYPTLREVRAAAKRVCEWAGVPIDGIAGIASAAAWYPDAPEREGDAS